MLTAGLGKGDGPTAGLGTGNGPTAGLGKCVTAVWLGLAVGVGVLGAQSPRRDTGTVQRSVLVPAGAPVTLAGDTLFELFDRAGANSAEDRAASVSDALARAADARLVPGDSLLVRDFDFRTELLFRGHVVMWVDSVDAAAVGMKRLEAAQEYASRIRSALALQAEQRSAAEMIRHGGIALGETLALIVALTLIGLVFPRSYRWLESQRTKVDAAARSAGLSVVDADRVVDLLLHLARILRGIAVFALVLVYLPLVLSLFPQTASIAKHLVGYLTAPVVTAGSALIAYLPNLLLIVVIVIATRFVLRILHGAASAIERGALTIDGFDADWAIPTYQILRPLVLALALVLAFPYLPGANSDAIKGVSLFLGLLVSLGSSSAIANLMAGIVLLYTRAFHVGDRVRISNVVGDVTSRSLLVTHLRTIKNVEVAIPNGVVLSGPIENFTVQAQAAGLILHTSVTIGYDAPWRQVHELMIAAALATPNIERDPPPFVLQTALNDFNVSYEINAYTRRAELMQGTYAALHENIQEHFNAAGVEIMSPAYHALRDGNTVTTPAAQRPKDYHPPTFRVSPDR